MMCVCSIFRIQFGSSQPREAASETPDPRVTTENHEIVHPESSEKPLPLPRLGLSDKIKMINV